ncbi:MAG: hypothetical protein IK017_05210 [Paludibacteraceae bacterium]|nr:hypothetical protein [Paludibacteraceae bacterium]
MKDIFQLEYVLGKVSQNVLWNALSTSDGLACWFADKVEEKENIFTFHWGRSEQSAQMLLSKANSHVRYRWEDEEDNRCYFEMRISVSEISEDVTLTITDFSESSDDLKDLTDWWNIQIEQLQKALGM